MTDGDVICTLDRIMAETTVQHFAHLGQWLAEWPAEPLKMWWLADSEEAAKRGLYLLAVMRAEKGRPL